jgi:hypothetical protein
MYHEVRDIKDDMTKLRQEQVVAYEKLNNKIKEKNEMRKLNDLEIRMTTRQNDIVKALTKKMVSREESDQSFRLMNERKKQIETVLILNINNGKLEPVYNEVDLPVRVSHGNYMAESPPRASFGVVNNIDQYKNKPMTPSTGIGKLPRMAFASPTDRNERYQFGESRAFSPEQMFLGKNTYRCGT